MSESPSRILVADDEPTALRLMQVALEKLGHVVTAAADGEEALRRFHAEPCDLAILDVDMPGRNGYQVCAALRAQAGGDLPILIITGLDDLASIQKAYESGATDFISKPINWSLIGYRVRSLLRAHANLLAMRTANARNAAILSAIPDALIRLDAGGIVLEARAAGSGSPALHLPVAGRPLAEVYPEAVARRVIDKAQRARELGAAQVVDFLLHQKDGPPRYYEGRISTIDERETLCLVRDVTERREAERRIFRLAYFDSLTSLPNRQSFLDRLAREVKRARMGGYRLGVLFLDLDGFKNVNDTLGHKTGDMILQWAADRLRGAIRPTDIASRPGEGDDGLELARLGGDEFTALVLDIEQPSDAMVVAHRIRESMRRPFVIDGREILLTASIGIAVFPDDGDDAATLLKHADTAMYDAKDSGRDNFRFYSASLTEQAMRRLNMENKLRLALERGEFFLVYQPQFDLVSGGLHSVEALIRWNHPERGVVHPNEFIHLAEANGLIVPIGEWVLQTACTDAARWNREGRDLRVAVNLSPLQFRDERLVEVIRQTLERTALDPAHLELEITESALMEDDRATLATLNALRALGVSVALDDFGTGYSSMNCLKRMPLNSIKVDQSFVQGLPHDGQDLAIVRAILSLAKSLRFSVTAEGVETLEQAQALRTLNCDALQGYYFSVPVSAADIPALLDKAWKVDEAVTPKLQAAG